MGGAQPRGRRGRERRAAMLSGTVAHAVVRAVLVVVVIVFRKDGRGCRF